MTKQFEVETAAKHPCKDVWRMYIKNLQVTAPAAVPQHYSSFEYLDGPPLAKGGIVKVNYNPKCFPHFQSLKFIWDYIDHDSMKCKLICIEGGYLEGQTENTVSYSLEVVPGSEPNTSILKYVFEFDEKFEGTFEAFVREEAHVMGHYLDLHLEKVLAPSEN